MESCNNINGARVKTVYLTRFIDPKDKEKYDSMFSPIHQAEFEYQCLIDGKLELTEIDLSAPASTEPPEITFHTTPTE